MKVATISRKVVTAKSEGTTIITAKTDDYSVTCVVTVKSATGVDQTAGDAPLLMIYDVTGRLVKANAKSTQDLEPGIYIINGRKTVVK